MVIIKLKEGALPRLPQGQAQTTKCLRLSLAQQYGFNCRGLRPIPGHPFAAVPALGNRSNGLKPCEDHREQTNFPALCVGPNKLPFFRLHGGDEPCSQGTL